MKCFSLGILALGVSLLCCNPADNKQNKDEQTQNTTNEGIDKYKIVYKGESGSGLGKNIVFLASDHEYRSEESLPALARILAKHHGFTCTVLFGLDSTGHILPGSSDIKGLQVLDDADLMVIFTRFLDLEDSEMQHIDNYLKSGKPVVGLRTATHAFSNKDNPKWGHYSWDYKGENKDWQDGFGELVLGETWVSHYGTNHKQSSRIIPEKNQVEHPIMRGVKDMAVQSGAYTTYPKGTVLARGEVLNGMTADSDPDKTKELLPVAWVRDYAIEEGKTGRAFATTHGASEDILNEGFRRLLVNSTFWALGMENDIKADNNISLVGPYKPTTFNFDGHKAGVKPSDLAAFDSLIMPGEIFQKKK
jgi:type 1 glutamine amidotransferase